MTRNHRQEALSLAYLQAVAACCGLSFNRRESDYGIDVTLNEITKSGRNYFESGVKVDVQVKSTTIANYTRGHVVYDLKAANYRSLRDPSVGSPRLLVIFVLPSQIIRWLTQSEEALQLYHAAYWMSLYKFPKRLNKKTVRIQIPRSNLLSVEALKSLMVKARVGDPL